MQDSPVSPPVIGRKALLGYSGAALMVVGLFCPILHVPFFGGIDFLSVSGFGSLVIGVSAFAAAYARYQENDRIAFLSGLAALITVVITLLLILVRLANVHARLQQGLLGDPFSGIAEVGISAVHIDWGLLLLFLACMSVLASAVTTPTGAVTKEAILLGTDPGQYSVQSFKSDCRTFIVRYPVPARAVFIGVVLLVLYAVADRGFAYYMAYQKSATLGALSLVSVSKSYEPSNVDQGQYEDKEDLVLYFKNIGRTSIRAAEGTLRVKDLFGNKLEAIRIDVNDTIAPGAPYRWEGTVQINEFEAGDIKLRDLLQDQLHFFWHTHDLVFNDGSTVSDTTNTK